MHGVGWRALIRGSTPWLTLLGIAVGGKVESTQYHRVGCSVLIRGSASWLTQFAVRNSCRA